MKSMKLDYSQITCPVSLDPISECECQNCVIARMDRAYELWAAETALRTPVMVALAFIAVCFTVGIVWAAGR